MRVELKPGETVDVVFEGTDGTIEVSFGQREAYTLTVYADLPDNTFNRDGVIYREDYGVYASARKEANMKLSNKEVPRV